MSYYKRINKTDYLFGYDYESLKATNGVITSTDENGNEFILVPTYVVDEYVPTTISRQDLASRGFDETQLDDEQMQSLAKEMGSLWVGFGEYWEQMDASAEQLGLEAE